MRKYPILALILWLCLVGCTNIIIPELQASLSEGLIVHYPFDGNASSGRLQGTAGEVVGASLVKDRFRREAHAYYFNGSSDYIIFKDANQFDVGTGDFALSVWIKTTTGMAGRIVSNGSDGFSTGYMIRMDGNGLLVEISSDGNPLYAFSSMAAVADGNWTNIVLNVERSTGARLYLNGVLDSEKAGDSTAVSLDNANLPTVGVNDQHVPAIEYFEGCIDDLRIYSRLLTAAEIASINQ
jgi:hypothetical protein